MSPDALRAESLWLLCPLLGAFCGLLVAASRRFPPLAWLAIAPLALATVWGTAWQAACAGVAAGALQGALPMMSRTLRPLLPLAAGTTALAWAIVAVVTQQAVKHWGHSMLVVLLPLCAALSTLFLRKFGAPRWAAAPLACTQEQSLVVLHGAGRGGALVVTFAVALSGSSLAALIVSRSVTTLLMIGLATLGLLAFAYLGFSRLKRACLRVDAAPRIRVAAVVADAPAEAGSERDGLTPMHSPAYRDVPGTVARYRDPVREAASQGARLLVLPEVAVLVDEHSRGAWVHALCEWARAQQVTIVAPYIDAAVPVNTLLVVDPTGIVGHYDKQHPARGLEPAPRARTTPAGHTVESVPFSAVICVDLDYPDLVPPVRRRGGLLVAPSNDWFDGFERLHDDTSVWAAVATGVSVLRSTGHGLSSLRDGAGRLLAQRSSRDGAVVLVVDAPVDTGVR